ncbi:xylulokinase [Conexibacter sp. DBS9H8]|uniref:xylulokinase n=1 Tax=Conexibacter sp. DBS9H8 TaxID=2937801 RepID=UPI00200FE88F|nr:xylulokinase [Conexibacter sp. DBS9H8]
MVIGLDIGTSGVKGVAVTSAGRVAARAEEGYALSVPRPGWAEQEPERWWEATAGVLERLCGEVGRPVGIGLSGQMHGLVALDGRGRPLRPAILWNDQRASAECEEIEATFGAAELVRLTGNRALAGFTAPKLLWMRRHEPDLYARIAAVLLPKDYVRLRLCGEYAHDVSDASGTLLFDVAARTWSAPVADGLEIPLEWFAPALESGAVAGHTADGIPVVAGAGDQAAGAVGVGVLAPGVASVVLGTSGVVFAPLASYRPDPAGTSHTFCHAVADTWHGMGVMLSAAGSLQWLAAILAPGADIGALVAEAARWEPGVEGLTFLPYLAGERTPHADPHARGVFAGLSLRHDRGALVRAVMEGVCAGLRDCLDLMRSSGATIDAGVLSGGGARSDLWAEIAAGMLELPLTRTDAADGAAFGAALLAGVSAGFWRDLTEATAAAVRPRDTIEPVAADVPRYRELQRRFRALYPAISAVSPESANPAVPAP